MSLNNLQSPHESNNGLNKRLQKVNEFCKLGNLENYRHIIEMIFERIDQAKCRITGRSDGGPSIHEFESSSNNCIIRISFKKQYYEPIEIIWTILHEFGHHLSGEMNIADRHSLDVRISREKLAWGLARKEINNYPELAKKISNFDDYARKCLESYINLKNKK